MRKSTYQGLPTLGSSYDLNRYYLDTIRNPMDKAVDEYPRVFAVRFDLHQPELEAFDCLSRDEVFGNNALSIRRTYLATRFIQSFKAKLKAHERKARREGTRVYPCTVRFVWVRERDKSAHDHYHFVLLLNRDRFWRLGDSKRTGSLAWTITSAWASALNRDVETIRRLVHFPDNACYVLERKSEGFIEQYNDLFCRLSYFTKHATKYYGEDNRCIGRSIR
ncbi:TPA: inovirus Gp2 family protein [Vibrio parahaemolyticus]|nr:inovirus Gp2 family protein [Vibrio parahaemolyticus]HCG7350660.1 inovirus Gp2 family protein [Vibrio parahaemolyticus]